MKNIDCEMGEVPAWKRRLSIIQLIFLNAVVCGTEFCASAGFTYIPPMLLKAGFVEQHMSIILGMGPLLGIILVPMIGRWSDQCQNSYGRRRPFIFGLSMIIIFSLILIPYGEVCVSYVFSSSPVSSYLGVVCLAVGVILLDFSSQALLNPCEAMLADACKHTTQTEQCFQVYSVMISIGGCIGYLVTALDWKSTSVGVLFGSQEKSAFSVLAVFFILTLCITLTVVEEIPFLEDVNKEDRTLVNGLDPGYESETPSDGGVDVMTELKKDCENNDSVCSTPVKRSLKRQSSLVNAQCGDVIMGQLESLSKCQGLVQAIGSSIYLRLPAALQRQLDLPYAIRILALTDFFSWTAIFSFNLFYSDFVGQSVYKGNPNAPDDSLEMLRYDEGVRMGSWGLLLHCIVSGLSAVVMDRFTDRYGFRQIFLCGLMSFTIAMIIMILGRDSLVIVTLMACLTGFGYATLTTIPYSLVTLYLEDQQIYFYENYLSSNKPKTGQGVAGSLAVIDSAYFLSQVVLSAFMGYIVHYTGSVLSYLVCAATFGILACYCVSKTIFTRQDMILHIRTQRTILQAK